MALRLGEAILHRRIRDIPVAPCKEARLIGLEELAPNHCSIDRVVMQQQNTAIPQRRLVPPERLTNWLIASTCTLYDPNVCAMELERNQSRSWPPFVVDAEGPGLFKASDPNGLGLVEEPIRSGDDHIPSSLRLFEHRQLRRKAHLKSRPLRG